MAEFLSIVVPYYKENLRDMFPLLSSLNNQAGVDYREVKVILVNDGTKNGIEHLELFNNLKIDTIMMKENKGPGVARQVGLDAANGEYVMFCDADDTLHSVGVLGAMLQELKATGPDIMTTPWLEELYDGDGFVYIQHEDEATWMHGKAFRRSFLIENNIRFNDHLRVHEDSYFLSIAYDMTEDKRKLPVTSYVWRWNVDSITRRDSGVYTYDSIPLFNTAVADSFHALLDRGSVKNMPYKVVQILLYNYFCLNQDNWKSLENRRYLVAAEKSVTACFSPYIDWLHSAPESMIREVYRQERAKNFGDCIETETFTEWLTRLGLIKREPMNSAV